MFGGTSRWLYLTKIWKINYEAFGRYWSTKGEVTELLVALMSKDLKKRLKVGQREKRNLIGMIWMPRELSTNEIKMQHRYCTCVYVEGREMKGENKISIWSIPHKYCLPNQPLSDQWL